MNTGTATATTSATTTPMVVRPPRLAIQEFHIVLGDPNSNIRSTRATGILRDVHSKYAGKKKDDRNWLELALQEFRTRLDAAFQNDPAFQQAGGSLVILCCVKGGLVNRLPADEQFYGFTDRERPDFYRVHGKAGEDKLVTFLRRDPPRSNHDKLAEMRDGLNLLLSVSTEERDVIEDFDELLKVFEKQLQKSQTGPSSDFAKDVLDQFKPFTKLDNLWKDYDFAARVERAKNETTPIPINSNAPPMDDLETMVVEVGQMFDNFSMMDDATLNGVPEEYRARVQGYRDIYESEEYQRHYRNISTLLDRGSAWAWAAHVRNDDEAVSLDVSRKYCLKELLYRMYDECHEDPFAVDALKKLFKPQWASNVLQIGL